MSTQTTTLERTETEVTIKPETLRPSVEQPVFDTVSPVRETDRATHIDALNNVLADAIDLQMQSKMAHWNVRGANFMRLHELFDSVNAKARGFTDLIAERIGQLGGLVEGNVQASAARTRLDVYPVDRLDESEHVRRVAQALSTFATRTRAIIDKASESGDAVTEDIFTEISRTAEKMLWFVESHVETRTKSKSA